MLKNRPFLMREILTAFDAQKTTFHQRYVQILHHFDDITDLGEIIVDITNSDGSNLPTKNGDVP
jgi:hypothetical protein